MICKTINIPRGGLTACLLTGLLLGLAPQVRADDLGRRATWSAPEPAEVKAQVEKWVATTPALDDLTKTKVEALWPKEGLPERPTELLEQVATTAAVVDPGAAKLIKVTRGDPPLVLPTFECLTNDKLPEFVRRNLRLYYGKYLAQHRLYDECQVMLKDLKPADVVDPASLLFYQSVVHHRQMDKKKLLPTVAKLLENRDEIPTRFVALAELMAADLKPLKPDSLDEVARLMRDNRDRLNHGRAGKKVRKQQEEIIAKLDKKIEELEKQRQQQQQQQQAGGSNPSSPMQDSNPGGGSGPGDVDDRRLQDRGSWGNLPPKEREEALQQIGREYPSHFRRVVEEYFRKLAREGVTER